MATVGYGDFIPKSVMGRILGILICFWGVVVVSIFVVTLTSLLKFETAEEKTYQLLIRLENKKILKKRATMVLVYAYL